MQEMINLTVENLTYFCCSINSVWILYSTFQLIFLQKWMWKIRA